MRILMLDNEFPPLGGGMGTTHEALLKQFAPRAELEIDVITAALGKESQSEQFAERIRLWKVPVNNRNLHHSSNRELIAYTLQALPLALKLQRAQPYDFCFAWSALPAGFIARMVEWRTGLPYMVWVSGPDIPGFEQRYARLYPLLWPLLKTTWRHAKPLIAKCKQEVDMIHACDPNIPVHIIPNGVDLNSFSPGAPVPDDGPLKLICVARLIERKGQRHLIQAVQALVACGMDVTLDLVGTGDALPQYQKLASDLGIMERVNFAGYVSRQEIPQWYAAAHVFVLPSYNEGMALAALEALGAGLPLVLTRTGGTEELAQAGENGYIFEWGDVDALAQHLKRLAQDRELTRKMARASRARAKRFSWPKIAAEYIELFARM
ncbi:MAG: GDP-mannose-dependent alpha-(1-6)-phosphatidylinositol monomannoside mannosyltransferase [Anaerolineae bacterium]|nr:GDP-mannose-dependent alpha-(1-6)-phosphatidylinositol monomannoside mannosyltransferase [Anaerolineae bacterium]